MRFCYKNFKHYEIRVCGDYPQNLLSSSLIDIELTPELQYINMILSICENIQDRIEKNDDNNNLRIRLNQKSLVALSFILVCPILSYLLLLVFSHAQNF